MSVRKNNRELLSIMRSELCNRCGSCVGLSGGKIVFTDREGKYLPSLTEDLTDKEHDRLLNACSGKNFSFPEYNREFYREASHFHTYLGSYESLYTGYTTDGNIRSNSASGGLISALLIYLLEKKKIEGAIVTRMSHDKPWLTEPFIATSREEILEAAQSKYIITSVNEILSESMHFKGRLAFTGLPGQVQSIRKLQKVKDPAVANIDYIFGPFYGNTLYFSSVRSFLRSYGEKDYTGIHRLWFRYGEWPGNMRVEMKSGHAFELKKFHANYLIPFHIVKNSLYCTDLSNEFTDISGGDAWSPDYEQRGKGFSMVISRTKKGEELLKEMMDDGRLNLDNITEEEAITMHSHGYDFKKRGGFIRINFRRWTGRTIPDYGYTLKGFPFSRYLMETAISFLFLILGTRPSRWFVEQLSPAFVGRIFEKTRTVWKRSTHSIKRKDLQ